MMPFLTEILELATAGLVLAAAVPFLKKSPVSIRMDKQRRETK